MECKTTDGVQLAYDQCPELVRQQLLRLRQLVLDVATEEGVSLLEESLKWGQPSYLAKGGSTVRLGWLQDPIEHVDQVALFFHCQSRLVDTFREIYPDTLHFSGNRAIVCSATEPLPEAELKHCIAIALSYHRRKHLPLLGA